jgi:hypothetical protein
MDDGALSGPALPLQRRSNRRLHRHGVGGRLWRRSHQGIDPGLHDITSIGQLRTLEWKHMTADSGPCLGLAVVMTMTASDLPSRCQ